MVEICGSYVADRAVVHSFVFPLSARTLDHTAQNFRSLFVSLVVAGKLTDSKAYPHKEARLRCSKE